MERCDVLVVGGGPAGSSCAWRLRRAGLDVVVLDRKAFPRDKVCAGWITPQVARALEYVHFRGLIHRDVHPTRIHFNNGLCKFNLIGLPYNFKKLLKCTNYSGHVNYSAPEIISEELNATNSIVDNDDYVGEGNFTEKAEIASSMKGRFIDMLLSKEVQILRISVSK